MSLQESGEIVSGEIVSGEVYDKWRRAREAITKLISMPMAAITKL